MSKEVCLVIPSTDYKSHCIGLLDRLCQSIVAGGTDTQAEIVICLDAVGRPFREYFEDKYPDFTYLVHEGNRRNFCANSNMGLRYAHAKGMSAILTNQDTVLPDWKYLGWLTIGKGLCSTSSVEEADLSKLNTLNMETGNPIYTSVLEDNVPANKFAGYCYFINHTVMEEVGFLHEPYSAGFDDDEFITKTLMAGFPAEISNVIVYHEGTHIDQSALGGQSFTGAYGGDLLQMNHYKYRDRWRIPADVSHPQYVKWILANYKFDKELMYDA